MLTSVQVKYYGSVLVESDIHFYLNKNDNSVMTRSHMTKTKLLLQKMHMTFFLNPYTRAQLDWMRVLETLFYRCRYNLQNIICKYFGTVPGGRWALNFPFLQCQIKSPSQI
jgi:hypothetical protein